MMDKYNNLSLRRIPAFVLHIIILLFDLFFHLVTVENDDDTKVILILWLLKYIKS